MKGGNRIATNRSLLFDVILFASSSSNNWLLWEAQIIQRII